MSDDHTRRVAIQMLKAGIANLSEVARLAGVSRQAVRVWAKTAEIDWRSIRDARLQAMWNRRIK